MFVLVCILEVVKADLYNLRASSVALKCLPKFAEVSISLCYKIRTGSGEGSPFHRD